MITPYIKGEQHYDYKKDHIKRSRSAYGSSTCRLLRKYHQRFLQQQLRAWQQQQISTGDVQPEDIKMLFPVLEGRELELTLLYKVAQTAEGIRGAVRLFGNAFDSGDYDFAGIVRMAKMMHLDLKGAEKAGEEMTAAELLEAVIVSSANDACIALAEHAAGSEAAFVKLMNKRAREMKLKNTKFTGCVGFDAEGHYSSAEDIAIMTAELMTKEYYRGWLLTWLDYLRGGETQLLNTNKLVRYYDGILGGKTGTTDGAGCCLAACAQRGDMRLVAVVLGCGEDPERFDKAEELLDYGFSGFERFTPETDSRELLPIAVERGETAEVRPMVKSLGDCIIKKGCFAISRWVIASQTNPLPSRIPYRLQIISFSRSSSSSSMYLYSFCEFILSSVSSSIFTLLASISAIVRVFPSLSVSRGSFM